MTGRKKHSAVELIGLGLSSALGSYFLTNNLGVVIGYFKSLPSQGPLVYISSFVFLIALYLLQRGDEEEEVERCKDMLSTIGFMGTAFGFTGFLEVWNGAEMSIEPLKLAFLTTAQGLFYNALVMLVQFGSRRSIVQEQKDERHEESERTREGG